MVLEWTLGLPTPGSIFSAAVSLYISREHWRLRTTRHFVSLALLDPSARVWYHPYTAVVRFGNGLSCKIWPWQKVAPRTIFCRKIWPPRPILAAKSGPPLQNLAHPPNCSLLTLTIHFGRRRKLSTVGRHGAAGGRCGSCQSCINCLVICHLSLLLH